MPSAHGQYRNQIIILRAIRAHVAETGELPRQVDLMAEFGMDAQTVHAAFQWLRVNGYIERIGRGEYELTAKEGEPSPRWTTTEPERPIDRYAHLLRGVTMYGYGVRA